VSLHQGASTNVETNEGGCHTKPPISCNNSPLAGNLSGQLQSIVQTVCKALLVRAYGVQHLTVTLVQTSHDMRGPGRVIFVAQVAKLSVASQGVDNYCQLLPRIHIQLLPRSNVRKWGGGGHGKLKNTRQYGMDAAIC